MKLSKFIAASIVAVSLTACQEEDAKKSNYVNDYVVDASGGQIITKEMLGVNLLFSRDDVDGTFGERAVSVGAGLLRYPGGTIAEDDMDMYDINQTGSPTTLREALSYGAQNNMTVALTVPTKRYVNNLSLGVQQVGDMVRRVTGGEFGSTKVPIWEIGNEFYYSDIITADEYGRVAAALTKAVRDNAAYPVKIAVQGGQPGQNQPQRVASYFDKGEVDLIAHHFYPWSFDKDRTETIMKNISKVWGDIPYFASEWNVHSCIDPRVYPRDNPKCSGADFDDHDFGVEQASALLNMFEGMLTRGMEASAFWAIQQNMVTPMFHNEGVMDGEYVAGTLFRWLTETIGLKKLNTAKHSNDASYVLAFGNSNKLIVFVSGRTATQKTVKVKLNGFNPTSVTAVKMTGDIGTAKTNANVVPATVSLSGAILSVPINTLQKHEVIRIEVRK